jgi:hypothetical protein
MLEDFDSTNKPYFDSLKTRDYKCPCGKTYLSYAALFTHIKQKHAGKVNMNLFSHLEQYQNLEE